MTTKLQATFVVVPLAGDCARRTALGLAERGASVVLVAGPGDAEAAGRLAADVRSRGARVAVFTAEAEGVDTDALAELVGELDAGTR